MAGWDGVELAPYLAAFRGVPLFVAQRRRRAGPRRAARAPRHAGRRAARRAGRQGLDGPRGSASSPAAGCVAGHLGAAGEIGHTRVEAADGLPCRCGAPAAWRRSPAAGRWSRPGSDAAAPASATCATWSALAQQGDPEARGACCARAGGGSARCWPSRSTCSTRETVVIGGDMAAAFDVVRRRGARDASTRWPRRWPPASCSSCPPPTATGPAWSAAPPWRWSRCSAPPPWTPGWRPPASERRGGAEGPGAATTVAGMTRVHAFGDDALGDLDAVGLVARIQSRQVAVTEVVAAAIARAERVDPAARRRRPPGVRRGPGAGARAARRLLRRRPDVRQGQRRRRRDADAAGQRRLRRRGRRPPTATSPGC